MKLQFVCAASQQQYVAAQYCCNSTYTYMCISACDNALHWSNPVLCRSVELTSCAALMNQWSVWSACSIPVCSLLQRRAEKSQVPPVICRSLIQLLRQQRPSSVTGLPLHLSLWRSFRLQYPVNSARSRHSRVKLSSSVTLLHLHKYSQETSLTVMRQLLQGRQNILYAFCYFF